MQKSFEQLACEWLFLLFPYKSIITILKRCCFLFSFAQKKKGGEGRSEIESNEVIEFEICDMLK